MVEISNDVGCKLLDLVVLAYEHMLSNFISSQLRRAPRRCLYRYAAGYRDSRVSEIREPHSITCYGHTGMSLFIRYAR